MSTENAVTSFSDLDLPAALQRALNEVGYETPSAIQAMTIPHLLAGTDLVGQAQTGTGKNQISRPEHDFAQASANANAALKKLTSSLN